MTRGKDFVESLEKGLRIIEVFQTVRSELTLSDVAERVGITRAAARRYLLTLVQLGYASHEGRFFTLTPKVLILSRSHLGGNPILGVVQSALDTIAGKTRESASAAVLNASEIIVVARAQSPRPFSANVVIGTRLPAFRTAMGKILLGEHPENMVRRLITDLNSGSSDRSQIDAEQFVADIRRAKIQGFATSIGELETGLNSIAVPMHHPLCRQMLSLGLSVPQSRMTSDAMVAEFLPELQNAVSLLMRV